MASQNATNTVTKTNSRKTIEPSDDEYEPTSFELKPKQNRQPSVQENRRAARNGKSWYDESIAEESDEDVSNQHAHSKRQDPRNQQQNRQRDARDDKDRPQRGGRGGSSRGRGGHAPQRQDLVIDPNQAAMNLLMQQIADLKIQVAQTSHLMHPMPSFPIPAPKKQAKPEKPPAVQQQPKQQLQMPSKPEIQATGSAPTTPISTPRTDEVNEKPQKHKRLTETVDTVKSTFPDASTVCFRNDGLNVEFSISSGSVNLRKLEFSGQPYDEIRIPLIQNATIVFVAHFREWNFVVAPCYIAECPEFEFDKMTVPGRKAKEKTPAPVPENA